MFFFWDVYDDISHPGGVPMRHFARQWQVRHGVIILGQHVTVMTYRVEQETWPLKNAIETLPRVMMLNCQAFLWRQRACL